MAKKPKELSLSDVQKVIHNKSECMIKRTASAYESKYNEAATNRLAKSQKMIEDLSHVYKTIPHIPIPMGMKFTYGKDTVTLDLIAKVYRYKSYKELLAIFYCSGDEYKNGGTLHSLTLPGVLGIPNYDEDGFCIVFGDMEGQTNYRVHACGFGAFAYSPDGAESYMRSYFVAHAIECRNRTHQRKFGFKAMTWNLAPSAKTLLKIFFRKNEKLECEPSLPSAEALPISVPQSSVPPCLSPESSSSSGDSLPAHT